jgi:hypothetical protein
MNSIDKVTELQRIINTAQDDLAVLMKKVKRFKPATDSKYYLVKGDGVVTNTYNDNLRSDRHYYNNFNCYETKELATKAAKYMKQNNAITTACLQVDPDFVPDYLSGNQVHYSFDYKNSEIRCPSNWQWRASFIVDNGPCVSTQEKWHEAAALLKEWGVE